VPSKALEARAPGRPSNRAEELNAPLRPTSASISASGASGVTVNQPSKIHVRAAGGAITRSRPRSASPRSRTSAADDEPCHGSRRNGSSPVVRWKAYISPVLVMSRPVRAFSASTGGRSASVASTPGIFSSRIPAVAGGFVWWRTMSSTRRLVARRRSSGSRFQPL
jgi:hypothetical protein